MCGICGFTGTPDDSRLRRMVATLTHRGPDEDGHWTSDPVSLGMRRLSIIDLETGRQPATNETGEIVVVFNGEIYNHVELRNLLIGLRHSFHSHHSDTEVIAHLYEEYGDDFLERLNGMFAIALWDGRRQRLLLARDRVGIKPLYIAPLPDGGVAFASEIKAILASGLVPRTPDLSALAHYFTFKNVPAPFSAFAGIGQLRPGERLIWSDGRCLRSRWWHPGFEVTAREETEAVSTIRGLLESSVELQMRSDVPVGAFLSGGVDSSAVVALMRRLSTADIKTFTLVYGDGLPAKDADRAFARQISTLYGTDHHELLVGPDDLPPAMDAVVEAFDEPYSGVISTWFLTGLIAKHVKVALSGDGADELFGSYLPHRLAQPLAHLSECLSAGRTVNPEGLASFQDAGALSAILARGGEAARRMGQYISDDEVKRPLLADGLAEAARQNPSLGLVEEYYAAAGTSDPLNRALYVDFVSLLPDQVLAFVDRLSMAHSVEVRPPFLDHRLVDYVCGLEGALKIRGGRVKHILKEAVANLLPPDLVDRPKEGFLMPINGWLTTRLEGWARQILAPERLARHGLLNRAEVARLLDQHYGKHADHGNRLWNLISFQLWWDKYFS